MSNFPLLYYKCNYTHIEFGNIRKYFTTKQPCDLLFHFREMLGVINHVDTLGQDSSTEKCINLSELTFLTDKN